jgi:hypothetical protein
LGGASWISIDSAIAGRSGVLEISIFEVDDSKIFFSGSLMWGTWGSFGTAVGNQQTLEVMDTGAYHIYTYYYYAYCLNKDWIECYRPDLHI